MYQEILEHLTIENLEDLLDEDYIFPRDLAS